MMILHHFTSALHLPRILQTACLDTTESNVDMTLPHAGPDVVWLLDTDTIDPEIPALIHGLPDFKRRVRFTVDVPDSYAFKWTDWRWTAKMDAEWRDILVESAGGIEHADHWYVCPAPLYSHRWRSITDLETGETVSV